MNWNPLGTTWAHTHRAEVGWLVAQKHAVWKILAIDDLPMTPEEQNSADSWMRYGPGGPWPNRPYRASAQWVGGVKPDWVTPDQDTGKMVIRPDRYVSWRYYPDGRWPQCSCCGEPMPCRESLTDQRVDVELAKMVKFESRVPGSCWACGSPITSRQRSVAYPGPNLDYPGGPTARFHARESCRYEAEKYEARWLEEDPTRARMLTWPYCRGRPYWHNDGSSECVGGRDDCRGAETHNHGPQAGCRNMDGGCPRGCDPHQSRCRRGGRGWLRPPDLPQGGDPKGSNGLALDLGDPHDGRPTCPGHLLIHRDGSKTCTAGGMDDCWDGSKYRHDRHRPCSEQTHGCPTCDTGESLA